MRAHVVRAARSALFTGLFLRRRKMILQVNCMIDGEFLIYDSIMCCGMVPASDLLTATLA